MLKAKRLKSMFVLYSACAVMATGFTSQAASERPEVTTITETKRKMRIHIPLYRQYHRVSLHLHRR
ncbi:MAG: hypothetical protein ACLUTV_08810 [Dorea longicatena]